MNLKEQINAKKLVLQERENQEREEKEQSKLTNDHIQRQARESKINELSHTSEGKSITELAQSVEVRDMMFQVWDYFFNKEFSVLRGSKQVNIKQSLFNLKTEALIGEEREEFYIRVYFEYQYTPFYARYKTETARYGFTIRYSEEKSKPELVRFYTTGDIAEGGLKDHELVFDGPKVILEYISDIVTNNLRDELSNMGLNEA